ncbi:hypothetical protein MRX96_006465 [Rhipicephalus microplus]
MKSRIFATRNPHVVTGAIVASCEGGREPLLPERWGDCVPVSGGGPDGQGLDDSDTGGRAAGDALEQAPEEEQVQAADVAGLIGPRR